MTGFQCTFVGSVILDGIKKYHELSTEVTDCKTHHPGMGEILNTFWRTESDGLVVLMELELKAFIPSEILDLQATLFFSSYGNEKMFAGLC